MSDDYRKNKIAGMREMLNFLERHDEVTLPYFGTFHSFPIIEINEDPEVTKATVATLARQIKPVGKKFSNIYFSLRKEFSEGIAFEITWDRAQVCKRIVVGTKEIDAIEVEAIEAVEAHTEPATTEEIVEWVCPDSLMSSIEENK